MNPWVVIAMAAVFALGGVFLFWDAHRKQDDLLGADLLVRRGLGLVLFVGAIFLPAFMLLQSPANDQLDIPKMRKHKNK